MSNSVRKSDTHVTVIKKIVRKVVSTLKTTVRSSSVVRVNDYSRANSEVEVGGRTSTGTGGGGTTSPPLSAVNPRVSLITAGIYDASDVERQVSRATIVGRGGVLLSDDSAQSRIRIVGDASNDPLYWMGL